MKTIRSRLKQSVALLGLFALTSCDSGGSGEVIVPGNYPPPLYEIEPNDNALFADYIGEVLPGDFIQVEGHITEFYPDLYDGFAFYALSPVRLVVSLSAANPDADLDFCIYDPTVDQVIACWETGANPEIGVFDWVGPGEFHIVVASYYGDSNYLLQVEVQPLPFGMAAMTEDPLETRHTPSPLAIERFDRYHPPREPGASSRESAEVPFLSDLNEAQGWLPVGALRATGL